MSGWVSLRDSLGLEFRPIDTWPGRLTYSRTRSPFSAPMKDTLAMLKRELRELRARSIVLQIAIRVGGFRLDGLPRADARAEHPGVILTFESKHGSLRLFMDRFTTWEHNLRAVAMHLEHLRHAGLYGVGEDGQQYRGWQALPEGKTSEAAPATAQGAAEFLARHSGENAEVIRQDAEVFRRARRAAVRKLHPDAGGAHEDFLALEQATEILERLLGVEI